MAAALSTFTDYVNVTGPAVMTSAESVVNEAQKQNYLLRRFLKGKSMEELIQGGKKIQDSILFDEDSTFQFYQPNETFTWTNPQVIDNWEVDWRFAVDHYSFTDHEIELNIGGGMTSAYRHHQYKRLKRIKEQRLWTSMLNGIENHIFAVPETANMEAAGGKQPYSLAALVNEDTNGLFYSGATPAGKTAWTTVQNINPTTSPKWVPQQKTYSDTTVNNTNNIVSKMDEMFLDVRFEPPPTHQEYFENPHLEAQFIACSHRGISVYRQLLRASQDLFVTPGRQDPHYARPTYAGIPLEHAKTLGTAKLYDNGDGTPTRDDEIPTLTSGTDSGPRYYFLNAWYIKPVFHTRRYMYKKKVREHPNQPYTQIVPVDCWYNFVCRSRQRQGILSPSGSQYT